MTMASLVTVIAIHSANTFAHPYRGSWDYSSRGISITERAEPGKEQQLIIQLVLG